MRVEIPADFGLREEQVQSLAELDAITVVNGEHPQAADDAEEILLQHAHRLGIFQRAGEIVKVITLPKALQSHGLIRPAGTVMLKTVDMPVILETFERIAIFQKYDEDKEPVRINCPDRIARAYLSRRGDWRLDVLAGLISTPVMRPDGSILDRAGYDAQTGLYLTSAIHLDMPAAPTIVDARRAVETLCAPFAEFPFCDKEDKSVHIAAILTAIERRLLGPCPLAGYSAPAPRNGKSKLAESVGVITEGKPPAATAVSSDPEEFRKALFSALREGHAHINLDNIDRPLKSKELCTVLTQSEFADRVLGENRRLHLPTNVLWTATGNNLAFRGDLATRALICRIDAKTEKPEGREFKIKNLEEHLLEHRAELIAAALTILRAYHIAECPEQNLPEWGGFEEWSRVIRQPLVWAGMTDPCKTRDNVLADDPEKETAGAVFQELKDAFPKGFRVSEVIKKANDAIGKAWAYPELHDALAAVTGGHPDSKAFGYWLRTWRDRYADGLRLVRTQDEGGHTNSAKWRIESSCAAATA